MAERIARVGLDINAIKLNPDEPFTWASGYQMPIYNDNRGFLANPEHRMMIAYGLQGLLSEGGISWHGIAGTSTAGISPATTFADLVKAPLIYVRPTPKDHGLMNQIEGIDAESDLGGRSYILVEDLISTGGSSVRAVQAIRDANGVCNNCFSIFTYGLDKATEAFDSLDPKCEVRSLLTYDTLLDVAKEMGYVNQTQLKMLEEWRADPFGWGENHGFQRVVE